MSTENIILKKGFIMNYKKSLLSLAAVMALSSSVTADNTATYLPLTSDSADSMWVLFGVNGFSDGTPSDIGTSTGSFQAGFSELEDTTTTDALATDGLPAGGSGTDYMASLQSVVISGVTSPSTLKVGMDMSGTIFDATEAVRTMYIKVNSSSPNLKFDYRASLEGKGMEILINGVLYSVYISQDSTYANAIDATVGSLAAAVAGANRDDIVQALDYNFSNNAVNPIHFDSSVHLDNAAAVNGASGAQTANMYHFDAITQQWEVWNKNSPANGNDFTTLRKGQAYWGRVDVNDSVAGGLINNDGGSTGLVLGRPTALSGIPNPDVYRTDDNSSSILNTGWNMLAFDDNKPYIRHAATGLILSGVNIASSLEITDASGLNSIRYDVGNTNQTVATAINKKIESAKLLGKLPATFNIKAFYSGTAGTYILISDEKFSVADENASTIAVTTLTEGKPYVAGVATTVTDLNASVLATSAYGEYTMMLDLMTSDLRDDNVTAELDHSASGGGVNVSAKVKFGDANGDNTALALTTVTDLNPTFTTAKAQIETDPVFDGTDGTGKVTAIDTDNSGTADKIIAASTIPFYVKDNTYVRVFTTATTGADGNTSLTISGASSVTITPDTTPTAAEIAALIQAQADASGLTGVYAAPGSTSTSLIIASTSNDLLDLKDAASSSMDLLSPGADSNETSAGALKGAYSLDHVAALPLIQHETTTTFTGLALPSSASYTTSAGYDINLTIDGAIYGSNDVNVTAAGKVDSAAGRKVYFDTLVDAINTLIKTTASALGTNVHGYAVHDFDVLTDDFVGTKILLAGVNTYDLNISGQGNLAALDPTNTTDANTATEGRLGSGITTGDLVSDVKANAIYSPNFAIQGPLYTLRNTVDNGGDGYDIRAILKATTEMDDTTSNVAWDSIDTTRAETDWFKNNEFNLFKINNNSGYWVYLDSAATNAVNIGTASISGTAYTYYFDRSSQLITSSIITSGQISVTITGLDDTSTDSGSAYAIVAGEEIRLARTTGTDIFTGDLSTYILQNFAATSAPVDVKIRAVNGKGQEKEVASAITIDYSAPTNVTAADSNVTGITLGSDGNATNYYVYDTFVPELQTTRLTDVVANVSAGSTFNACANSNLKFGGSTGAGSGPTAAYSLIIVAADGTIDTSNLSNGKEYIYAPTLKGSHVLTHIQGGGTQKSQLGKVYDSSCTNTSTQTLVTENNGVSLATLATGATARLAFVPDTVSNFTQDLAWTSNYALNTAGGTAIIQVQSTSAYAADTFYVEYGGNLYTGTFPSTQIAADQSIASALALTKITNVGNTSLAP